MKPISSSSVSATQPKPYLPPKPIRYRSSAPSSAASCVDQEPQNPARLNPPPQDQLDPEPLSTPRSHQGPQLNPRNTNAQPIRLRPSPRLQRTDQGHQSADQGHRCPPSPNNLGPSRVVGPGGRSSLNSSDKHLHHSQSRSERMKLERERFLANLIQSEGGAVKLTQTTNSVSESVTESSRTHPSISPNTDNLTTEFSVTSPNQKSSSARKQTIAMSSAMEVTSSCSHTKPSVITSSSKKPTVTSSEAAGSDVIYDEPSVEFERKSLERLVLSDGYLKLRSDVPEMAASVRGGKAGAGHSRRNISRNPNDPSDQSRGGTVRPSRSSESVDRLEALLDFSDYGCSSSGSHAGGPSSGKGVRSSFVDPNGPPSRRSVYIELGEYQTLLKHSKNDEDCVYSLPQPLCYSEDTLKAVKLITEKYDTFKRRQLRALSFRDGTVITNRKSPDGVEQQPPCRVVVPESITESNNNKSSGGCASAVEGVTVVAPVETDTGAKSGVESAKGKKGHDEVIKSKQPGSLLLRDYCNTLETGVDGSNSEGGLSKLNLMRIELFYRSQEADVYVCRCLADLFVGTSVAADDSSAATVHQHTGVPVWVLNSGEGVRGRELLLVVAERETGFPLWQDKINYLSNYDDVSPGVHSLRVSGSLRKTVRLHMFCERSAAEFLARFHEITADPNDDLWKISSKDATTDASRRKSSGQRKKTTKKKKVTSKRKRPRLSKASISQPCNFVHISRVDPMDPNFRAAFSGLVPLVTRSSKSQTDSKDPSKAFDIAAGNSDDPSKAFGSVDPAENENNSDSSACEFRPRLPTR